MQTDFFLKAISAETNTQVTLDLTSLLHHVNDHIKCGNYQSRENWEYGMKCCLNAAVDLIIAQHNFEKGSEGREMRNITWVFCEEVWGIIGKKTGVLYE